MQWTKIIIMLLQLKDADDSNTLWRPNKHNVVYFVLINLFSCVA